MINDFLPKMKQSTRHLRNLPSEKKTAVLNHLVNLIHENVPKILTANQADILGSQSKGAAFIDRLTLNERRIQGMIASLQQVSKAADPVGEVVDEGQIRSGVKFKKIRSPLGVILVIFESRPNVITEAFSLGFKAGNAVLLKAGKESQETAKILYDLIRVALKKEGVPEECFFGIINSDRNWMKSLLQEKKYIDVVIPRGGDALIEFVTEHSLIPIIKNDRGLCHLYLHEDAKPEMAMKIALNAKVQRPGVCNSIETLLIHEAWAKRHLKDLYQAMAEKNVEWFGCHRTVDLLKGMSGLRAATPESFDTEYLDLKINCKIVESLNEAIEHIDSYGSSHSEAIITETESVAKSFQREVDAAAVYWNASTRFTDGFEMGLGGEIGISTQKLHVRGPVGLRELTSVRWILNGEGQIRE